MQTTWTKNSFRTEGLKALALFGLSLAGLLAIFGSQAYTSVAGLPALNYTAYLLVAVCQIASGRNCLAVAEKHNHRYYWVVAGLVTLGVSWLYLYGK